MMNKLKIAEQFRKAVQLFAQSLDDKIAMEISTIYPKYEVGKLYKADDLFTFGENMVGDPQLYRVNQEHTSQADWLPNNTPSLYKAIGIVNGYDEWSQPSGAHDTYDKGDIVWYNETLYISTVDNNAYAPGVVDGQWINYEG